MKNIFMSVDEAWSYAPYFYQRKMSFEALPGTDNDLRNLKGILRLFSVSLTIAA